jgi:DNA-binding MarR family transcriptional regulator
MGDAITGESMSHRTSREWTSRAVAESVRRLQRILHDCDLFSRRAVRHFGVSGVALWALRTALDAECMTVEELVQRLHLDPITVSGIVDRLEARDLASRRRAYENPRVAELRLSLAGRKLASEAPESPHGKLARGVEALSSEELVCVHRAIEILGKILDVAGSSEQDSGDDRETGE